LLSIGASRVSGDINLYSCLTLKDEVLEVNPEQIKGSKHPVMYYKGILHLGCIKINIEEATSALYKRGGVEFGYTPAQILEYEGYFKYFEEKYKTNIK
jgi:hypothetical protein